MGRRQQEMPQDRAWFLSDRAIRSVDDDLLQCASVAETLVTAIESAEPPCMIGLLAGFGKGKSSTTNIASAMLAERGVFDAVTVTADKHSGSIRARNLVHAVAGELRRFPEIKEKHLADILRPLRQSRQIAILDPTDTPLTRVLSGRSSATGLLALFLPALAMAAAIAVPLALAVSPGLGAFAAVPVLAWFWWVGRPHGKQSLGSSLLEQMMAAATVTDQTPRAEAADEIEEVFGRLIDLHHKKRQRKLVVFVDDIDRLSNDDLLDALRSLRSLQSVPRDREPVFVMSCDGDIVRSAVRGSRQRPAGTAVSDDAEEGSQDLAQGEHDHPAVAFVDKLLTVRIQMPPTMYGDMRRFALDAVGSDHPLRHATHVDIERIVSILIHDGVDEPRTAVRLLNRFIGGYLLGLRREHSKDVHLGDVTHHLDVLAQLCVLLDEYPRFYEEIAANPALLAAAFKVALRDDDNLLPSEIDAIAGSKEFERIDDSSDGRYTFKQPTLRRYLAGTARRVRLPEDIGPLVHFTATPGGRVLGAKLRSELVGAVRSGDPVDLAAVLGRVPEDVVASAAGEIAEMFHLAFASDALTFIAAVVPNLSRLEADAGIVADACADLLDSAPDDSVPAGVLTTIMDHAGPERDALLCARLVRHDDEPESTSARLANATTYMASNPRVRDRVEPAVQDWVEQLSDQGSWSLARPWLEAAEALNSEDHELLLRTIAKALVRSVRSEDGFTRDDCDRLVGLATVALPGDFTAAPRSAALADSGPNTKALLLRLWEITEFDGEPAEAFFASEAARSRDLGPDERRLAVRLVSRWAAVWTPVGEDGDHVDEAYEIVQNLDRAARDSVTRREVAGRLVELAAHEPPNFSELLATVVGEAVALTDSETVAEAEPMAEAVIQAAALTDDPNEFETVVAPLLVPADTEDDPTNPAVQMTLGLIRSVCGISAGGQVLANAASRWSVGIAGPGQRDSRTRVAAFRVLSESHTDPVRSYARTIWQSIENCLANQDNVEDRLRVVADFPWPGREIPEVVRIVDAYWDTLPDGPRRATLAIVPQAPNDSEPLPRFHDRIAVAVKDDPHGPESAIAAREASRMDERSLTLVLAAAVGKHGAVTAHWTSLDENHLAATIATVGDDETASRLIGELDDTRRQRAAAAGLRHMVSIPDIAEPIVKAVAAETDSTGLTDAAKAALGALADPEANAQSALTVVVVARAHGASLSVAALQRLAPQLLRGGSLPTATLLGRALASTRRTAELRQTLAELRASTETAAIAGAFDKGYSMRSLA